MADPVKMSMDDEDGGSMAELKERNTLAYIDSQINNLRLEMKTDISKSLLNMSTSANNLSTTIEWNLSNFACNLKSVNYFKPQEFILSIKSHIMGAGSDFRPEEAWITFDKTLNYKQIVYNTTLSVNHLLLLI